jgi:metal-sulfur cluster biosynthetic enzyme
MSDSTPSNHVVWQADQQDPARAGAIREALREVADPELGLNVIELGLVRDLAFDAGKVAATVVLTTPFCPYGPAMIEQMRQKIAQAAKAPATIEMSPEMWAPSMMEDGAAAEWGFFGGY